METGCDMSEKTYRFRPWWVWEEREPGIWRLRGTNWFVLWKQSREAYEAVEASKPEGKEYTQFSGACQYAEEQSHNLFIQLFLEPVN